MFRARAVTIACTDLDRSAHFYEDVLGAVPAPGDGFGCRWYTLGALSFSLMPNAAEPSPARMPDHAMAMLWLETDDLEAAAGRIERHDVEVLQPADGQSLMIVDPDGIVIEIWQAEAGDLG